MTLNCEGMTATPGWETEVSSHVKETSKRRLSSGSERGEDSSYSETPSWEFSVALVPNELVTLPILKICGDRKRSG